MANTPVARPREVYAEPLRVASGQVPPGQVPSGNGETDLVQLVDRVTAGDPAAEGLLVERFSRGLCAYLRRIGCPPELSEDLHQETFRIALERLRDRGLDEPARLAGFLRGTARNLYFDERRKYARRQTENDDDAIALMNDPRSGQLRRVLDAEAATLVRRLIDELEVARDRQILYRFYIAEDRKETVCRELGLTVQHFNRVLFRARRRFKELLEGFEKREKLRRVS